MSQSQPILSEFLTKEELAAELRRNPRTLDRWQVLGMGPPRTQVGRKVIYRKGERGEMARWRKSIRGARRDRRPVRLVQLQLRVMMLR